MHEKVLSSDWLVKSTAVLKKFVTTNYKWYMLKANVTQHQPDLSNRVIQAGTSVNDGARSKKKTVRNQVENFAPLCFICDVAVLPNKFKTSLRWFSHRDQNAWDLRKLCTYKQDNAFWNDFRTCFQDYLIPCFVCFIRYICENLPLQLCWIAEWKHNRQQAIQDFRAQFTFN